MNANNLHSKIEFYIKNFDFVNNETNREYYKWEAIKHFQNHWDIDASDFSSMFKESMSKTSNLINNRIVQPINGIIKLAENYEYCNKVREAFKELFYTKDDGDIEKRQKRIECFVDSINNWLDICEHGKWKYKQDFRVGLFYLNMFAPQENYLFKSTNCRLFKDYIEFESDFGSGADFSLKKYYKMCDVLLAAINESSELKELHRARLNDNMVGNDNYHILTFDIIYCLSVYDLYGELTYTKRKKMSANQKALSLKQEELTEELKNIQCELSDNYNKLSEYDDFSIVGTDVKNKLGKTGVVIAQNEGKITVKFADKEVKFVIPNAFSDGFLITEDFETIAILKDIAELNNKIHNLKLELQAKEIELKKFSNS